MADRMGPWRELTGDRALDGLPTQAQMNARITLRRQRKERDRAEKDGRTIDALLLSLGKEITGVTQSRDTTPGDH